MTIVESAGRARRVVHDARREAAAERLGVNPDRGLDADEVTAAAGRVRAATSWRPSRRRACGSVARGQLANPMNIMLLIVGGGQLRDRAGRHRRRGAGAGDVQRRHGLEPGAQGAGQRRGTGPAPGPARAGAAIRRGRGGRIDRPRARGHRPARGRRRRACGRADPVLGHARGPGGGAHRRERAGEQGPLDAARGRGRAGRPDQPRLPEHAGHPRHGDVRGHRDRSGDPDGPDRRHGHRRPSGRARRCSGSSTA